MGWSHPENTKKKHDFVDRNYVVPVKKVEKIDS